MVSGRPADDEFASYARADIDYVMGDDAVGALAAQGKEVAALLASLDEEAIRARRYAPGKWTVKEVIGHLIDDERIFAYRALCVARGDARPLPGFEENDYVAATDFESRPLAGLIAEYRVVRAATLALFEPLTAGEWARRGNVNGYEASVRGLAFHVAGHELHHLRTLREKYLRGY
ncbi:MAG TPA: DinB family protein [Thermoanaerobaculia bacterium]|nr:DinB family protein [Thermoanaerobaculia bacterium]